MKIAVVGAGPAGVSAVAWLHKLGCDCDWFDVRGEIGGMLHDVHNAIDDAPGLSAENGTGVAELLRRWSPRSPSSAAVARIEVEADGAIALDTGARYGAVILATGTRKRRLDVPGEGDGLGEWVQQSAARDAPLYRGRDVAVVGGGDSAVEGCIRLAEAGARTVSLIARSPLRARRSFVEQLQRYDVVNVLEIGREVRRFDRDGDRCRISLDDGSSLRVAAVFVRIGVEPVVPEISPAPDRDERGFILVDSNRATSLPGVFAAGDVTSTPLRSIATSLADGAIAAQSVAILLERR